MADLGSVKVFNDLGVRAINDLKLNRELFLGLVLSKNLLNPELLLVGEIVEDAGTDVTRSRAATPVAPRVDLLRRDKS